MPNKNTKVVGVLLLFLTMFIIVLAMQTGNVSTIQQSFIKDIKQFDLGEKITFYETPRLLTPEQEQALKKYTEDVFYSDDLPKDYVVKATSQQKTDSTVKTTQGQTDSSIIATSSSVEKIVKRGEPIIITGKIEKTKTAPPYFFNVLLTCCQMTSFRAMSAVETEADGVFLVKIYTTSKFPLGDWTLTISTIGDDNKVISHEFRFRIVE